LPRQRRCRTYGSIENVQTVPFDELFCSNTNQGGGRHGKVRDSIKTEKLLLGSLLVLALFGASSVAAQTCEDFDECTVSDTCADGMCVGSPRNSGTCDDGNECTVNDTCVSGTCQGTPAPGGTSCGGGCGSCLAAGPTAICLLDFAKNGQPCDDDLLCTTNDRCQFGVCFGDFKFCPDSDGNACTFDFCHPLTGACTALDFPPCSECETCVDMGGGDFRCDASGNGNTCDDFNECTADGTCSAGDCLEGPPIDPGAATPTATATRSPTLPAATTPTATVPPSGCPGDCSGDGDVTVDEIISGVNIALGSLPVSNCTAMDDNADGDVTVDEILKAINGALNGCP